MRNVIVLFDTLDPETFRTDRYEHALAQLRAEIAALEIEYARVSAERHGRFQQRLESTRKELRDTRTRLKSDILTLEQERDVTLQHLHEQLANSCAEVRGEVERRLADVQADYRARIDRLTRAWELADSAITG